MMRIAQIKEQLNVAAIQKRVLTTVAGSEDADLEPTKMESLAFGFVTVSDLYNEYACPLSLFDVCLFIYINMNLLVNIRNLVDNRRSCKISLFYNLWVRDH